MHCAPSTFVSHRKIDMPNMRFRHFSEQQLTRHKSQTYIMHLQTMQSREKRMNVHAWLSLLRSMNCIFSGRIWPNACIPRSHNSSSTTPRLLSSALRISLYSAHPHCAEKHIISELYHNFFAPLFLVTHVLNIMDIIRSLSLFPLLWWENEKSVTGLHAGRSMLVFTLFTIIDNFVFFLFSVLCDHFQQYSLHSIRLYIGYAENLATLNKCLFYGYKWALQYTYISV